MQSWRFCDKLPHARVLHKEIRVQPQQSSYMQTLSPPFPRCGYACRGLQPPHV